MRSHTYHFQTADLMRMLALPLVPLLAFAVFMHVGARLHLLPKPRPNLDVDRTILIQKVEASGSRSDAKVVLIGDSSCLMDVSAPQLSGQLGQPVLNLGTLSYLDLEAHATLLKRFFAANPNQLKAVVLLLHPEGLRRPAPEPYHTKFLQSFLAGEDHIVRQNVPHWVGLEIFRARLLSRVLPTPLGGAYGRFYGFSSDLEKYLTQNKGSAVDPDPRSFQGNAEYRLAPQLETKSRTFKAALPPGVRLFVAITPAPAGFVNRNYAELHRQMLRQWRGWLEADVALEELPAVLRDELFAKTTHLNEIGAETYTTLLARALQSHAQ
jgi:hypothetical protein